jgi:hypothetical protein
LSGRLSGAIERGDVRALCRHEKNLPSAPNPPIGPRHSTRAKLISARDPGPFNQATRPDQFILAIEGKLSSFPLQADRIHIFDVRDALGEFNEITPLALMAALSVAASGPIVPAHNAAAAPAALHVGAAAAEFEAGLYALDGGFRLF